MKIYHDVILEQDLGLFILRDKLFILLTRTENDHGLFSSHYGLYYTVGKKESPLPFKVLLASLIFKLMSGRLTGKYLI